MDAQQLEPLVGHLAERGLLAAAHMPTHAAGEVPPEGLLVDFALERSAHPAQRIGHALHAALVGDDHELAQAQPLLQVELAHHPEIDEGQHAGVQVDEQVAGVRVGVEEAVHRELLDERAERVAGDQVAVEARRFDGPDVTRLDALHELLGDDLGRREVVVDDGHVHAGQALHVLGEADGVVGLAAVVQLLEDAGRELLEVDLGGGGRRERLGLERGVQLFRRRPQLFDDALAHLVAGERRDGVLELGELRRHVHRQH